MARPSKQDRFREAREAVASLDYLQLSVHIAMEHDVTRDDFIEIVKRMWDTVEFVIKEEEGKQS